MHNCRPLSVVGAGQLEAAQLETAAAPSRPVHRPVQQRQLWAALSSCCRPGRRNALRNTCVTLSDTRIHPSPMMLSIGTKMISKTTLYNIWGEKQGCSQEGYLPIFNQKLEFYPNPIGIPGHSIFGFLCISCES